MIKILHVIGTLRIGGAENIAMNFFRYADRTKMCMDYLVYDFCESEYTEEIERLGGKVIRINGVNAINARKKIGDFLKNNYYDVVHSHLMFHNGIIMKCAYEANVPIRVSHAHSTNSGRNACSLFYHIVMRNWIKKYSTKYIACGGKAGNYLFGKEFFEKKGFILNNRIELEKYRYSLEDYRALRKRFLWKDSDNIFLMVGHLESVKNHKFSLEIVKEYINRYGNIKLIILGEGLLRRNITNRIRKMNLEKNVFLLGDVKNVNEYMKAADGLLMPSLYEGFPLTLIEAQASGLPCIVSDRISDKVKVTNLVNQLSIDNGVDKWVKAISLLKEPRIDMFEILKKKGFHTKEMRSDIEKLYLEV